MIPLNQAESQHLLLCASQCSPDSFQQVSAALCRFLGSEEARSAVLSCIAQMMFKVTLELFPAELHHPYIS